MITKRPPFMERVRRWLSLQRFPSTRGKLKLQRSTLRAKRINSSKGEITDYGVISKRLVTQAFAKRLAAEMASNWAGGDAWKYHGSGTNSAAEANSQTALGAEVGSRVAGTQVDVSAGTTGNYQSIATITYGSALSITEHGLFNAAAAGTMLDRSKFTAIVVGSGDSIVFTYDLTINPE